MVLQRIFSEDDAAFALILRVLAGFFICVHDTFNLQLFGRSCWFEFDLIVFAVGRTLALPAALLL